MVNPADHLVDYGLWPKAWAGAVILGRRRVATVPQATMNMAIGQRAIGQPAHSNEFKASS